MSRSEADRWPDSCRCWSTTAEQPCPLQIVHVAARSRGASRLSFMADLPALGYRIYRLLPEGETCRPSPTVQASDGVLENARFRLEFDPESGYIASLYDKRRRRSGLHGPGGEAGRDRRHIATPGATTSSASTKVIGEFKADKRQAGRARPGQVRDPRDQQLWRVQLDPGLHPVPRPRSDRRAA